LKRGDFDSVLVLTREGQSSSPRIGADEHQVTMQRVTGPLDSVTISGSGFDCAVILFELEKSPPAFELLRLVHRAMRPGGVLLMAMPSLIGRPSRAARRTGSEGDKFVFHTRETLHLALLHAGFGQVEMQSRGGLSVSTEGCTDISVAAPRGWLARLGGTVTARLGRGSQPAPMAMHGITVSAYRETPRTRPLLSIVMPVFNERASFQRTIERVLDKELVGVDKELIVVESNSTDGTREVVEQYRDHPQVTVLLQEQPRGKGNAVRAGIDHAKGDIIVIQDADEEYDVDDYDALLRPLLKYQKMFVLGSRHSGHWKIRHFNDQERLASVFNVGHFFFLTLFNAFYHVRLRDPFTMYKVFFKDAFFGTKLESNRFDLDFELVAKLIRKGYCPVEIPVNYNARSFREGKKVSMFRDPMTWLWALVKFRLVEL